MKSFAVTLVAGLVAISAAQDLSKLPQCAKDCVGNSLSTTGCKPVDVTCICNSKGWIAGLSCCIAKGCSTADQESTIQFASSLCQTFGITIPSQASCASTAGPTATSSGSGAASTASGSMTTTMTGSVSGSTTPPTSGTTTAGAAAASSAVAANYKAHSVGVAGVAIAALAML